MSLVWSCPHAVNTLHVPFLLTVYGYSQHNKANINEIYPSMGAKRLYYSQRAVLKKIIFPCFPLYKACQCHRFNSGNSFPTTRKGMHVPIRKLHVSSLTSSKFLLFGWVYMVVDPYWISGNWGSIAINFFLKSAKFTMEEENTCSWLHISVQHLHLISVLLSVFLEVQLNRF